MNTCECKPADGVDPCNDKFNGQFTDTNGNDCWGAETSESSGDSSGDGEAAESGALAQAVTILKMSSYDDDACIDTDKDGCDLFDERTSKFQQNMINFFVVLTVFMGACSVCVIIYGINNCIKKHCSPVRRMERRGENMDQFMAR